jgi:riboflavin synthase alpha subunit
MKIKVTIKFKNGSTVKIMKPLSAPPKGTDINTHYMLESVDLVEKIQNNGLCLTISPAQIGNVFIQPRVEGTKNESDGAFDLGRQVVQRTGVQSAPQA